MESSSSDQLTQNYEEQITELHSVIAELTRKLEEQKSRVIFEEDEDEDEDQILDFVDNCDLDKFSLSSENMRGSCDSLSNGLSESEVDCSKKLQSSTNEIICDFNERSMEAGQSIAELGIEEPEIQHQNTSNVDVNLASHMSLEEEPKYEDLLKENRNMKQTIELAELKDASQKSTIFSLTQEKDVMQKKLNEYEKMKPGTQVVTLISDAVAVRGLRRSPLHFSQSHVQNINKASSISVSNVSLSENDSASNKTGPKEDEKIICKLAERVRLKKAESGDVRVTGSDISNIGVISTAIAEQLVAGMQEESDAQELFNTLATAGGTLASHERLKEYELEIEHLHARIEHLRAHNDVLEVTLSESKACCDRLSLKTNRAEAQCGSLKMAVEILDQIHEYFDVFTSLLEAKIALLVITCQVTGVDLGPEMGFNPADVEIDPVIRIKRAQEQKRSAENVARHLISRLQLHHTLKLGQEYDDTNSTSFQREEQLIRLAISRLQGERSTVLSSWVENTETSPLEDYFPLGSPLSCNEARTLDLENAVLMQELGAIREERAELRAQVYVLEREKSALEQRIGSCEAQVSAYVITVDHLKQQVESLNSTEDSEGAKIEDESSRTPEDTITREEELKKRVDSLICSLEKVTKHSEERHRQSQEFISDLKKANSALLEAVERLKKRYSLKVKRMEAQATNLESKHEQQLKSLLHRIKLLEESELRQDHQSS